MLRATFALPLLLLACGPPAPLEAESSAARTKGPIVVDNAPKIALLEVCAGRVVLGGSNFQVGERISLFGYEGTYEVFTVTSPSWEHNFDTITTRERSDVYAFTDAGEYWSFAITTFAVDDVCASVSGGYSPLGNEVTAWAYSMTPNDSVYFEIDVAGGTYEDGTYVGRGYGPTGPDGYAEKHFDLGAYPCGQFYVAWAYDLAASRWFRNDFFAACTIHL